MQILKQVKETLEQGSISQAISLVEKSSHPKLWFILQIYLSPFELNFRGILATAALQRLDLKTADHAFAKQQDYGGILFLKRLQTIPTEASKKAEVAMFLGDVATAENIYLDNDRRFKNYFEQNFKVTVLET